MGRRSYPQVPWRACWWSRTTTRSASRWSARSRVRSTRSSTSARGDAALERLADGTTDLVVLDIGLPDLDGVEVCRRARADHPDLAILILTARSAELDEVLGLDAGADDYLTKPFSLSVLTARVRALLRRRERDGNGERTVADVRVDPAARRAWRGDRELELSPKEFDLLALLVARAGEAVPRDEIMTTVWDENWWGSTKTLDIHVGWLRRKLGDPPLSRPCAASASASSRGEDAAPPADPAAVSPPR